MVAQFQQCFFDVNIYASSEGKKATKKRVRYKRPSYIKAYKFWHINPDTNEIQYDGDEKHIFRYQDLQKIYSLIYGYCDIDVFEQFETAEIDGLIVWGEDRQAEIPNTWNLPFKKRVTLHLKLLKLLRKGFTIKEALVKLYEQN